MAPSSRGGDSPSGGDRRAALDIFKGRLMHQHGQGVEEFVEAQIAHLMRQKAITPTDLTRLEDSTRDLARTARDRRIAERNSRQGSEVGSSVGGGRGGGGSEVGSRPASVATSRGNEGRETPGLPKSVKGRETPGGSGRESRAKDQWDLIIRFDKRNFETEEAKKAMAKRGVTHTYRQDLDQQMARAFEKQHEQLRERERDRQAMVQEQKKVDVELKQEEQERQRKVQVMKDAQERARVERLRADEKEAMRRARERDHLLEQVKREEIEDAEREKIRKEQQRRGAKEIVASMKEQMDMINSRKMEEAREDRLMAERYLRDQDAKEQARDAAAQARKDHLEKIYNNMGKGLQAAREDREKADEVAMIRAQEALETKHQAEQANKRSLTARRVTEMKDVRAVQIEEKKSRMEVERQEQMNQGQIFIRQANQAAVEDREMVQRRREQRRILDTHLAKQIMENRGRKDELEKAMPHLARREVEINQSIFREMRRDGFDLAETDKYMLR